MVPPGGAPAQHKRDQPACNIRTLARMRAAEDTILSLSERVDVLERDCHEIKLMVDLDQKLLIFISIIAICIIWGVCNVYGTGMKK